MKALFILSGLLWLAPHASARTPTPRFGPTNGLIQNVFWNFVSFPSLSKTPLTLAGRLRIPATGLEKYPAVLLVHGSTGVGLREQDYADVLVAAGFATLEVDLWSARGLKGQSEGDALKSGGRLEKKEEILPDIFGALAFLAKQKRIDPNRIGILGASFGGAAAMLAATRKWSAPFAKARRFAAIMALYPVCSQFYKGPYHGEFRDLLAIPIEIVYPENDSLEHQNKACERIVGALLESERKRVSLRMIAGAQHGFDTKGINQYLGGDHLLLYSPTATLESHAAAVSFFRKALQAPARN